MIEALEKLKAGNTLILFQSSSFRRAIKIQILAMIKKVYTGQLMKQCLSD
jgi:hypothetical protein